MQMEQSCIVAVSRQRNNATNEKGYIKMNFLITRILPILGALVVTKLLCNEDNKPKKEPIETDKKTVKEFDNNSSIPIAIDKPLNKPFETVKPTVQNDNEEPDKKELIRKYMSELGKKSGEARRRKKNPI